MSAEMLKDIKSHSEAEGGRCEGGNEDKDAALQGELEKLDGSCDGSHFIHPLVCYNGDRCKNADRQHTAHVVNSQ